MLCDLSDLGDIRRFAREFLAREPWLDVLVNNAGVLPAERTVTADGLELTFATNVAAPFLLTKLLLGLLRSSAPSLIVNVTSGGMYTQRLHVDDLQMERGKFDGTVAYARTKRVEMVLTELWAERLAGLRRRRARHAPGLGRHAGSAEIAANLPPADPAAVAHARAGRRHDRLAGGGRRARAQHRRLLARPAPAPHAPDPLDPRFGRRARGAVDGVRATDQRPRRNGLTARYTATLETPRKRRDVAAYLCDFSSTQEWDPGVVEAQRLDRGPVSRLGSRFRVVARFLGRARS